ncbi:unnamed protein product [Lathyrus sativus]|nr:unnamed protein product [Lathyrus sativus]
MEASISAVEKIIGYTFQNKKLLEQALTHTSYPESVSYERLEFIGDAVLGLAISNHLFLSHSSVDTGTLSLLRAANVSTEKLARAAVRNGLHPYVRHNTLSIVDIINEFVDAVNSEDDCVVVKYGGSVKAPKILADIVESIAAAVYVDVDFDLKRLWAIIKGVLEPIVTLDDLEHKPQPVTMLFEMSQKNGKKVDIQQQRNGAKITASVYVDGELIASASSDQKDIARLEAAKAALHQLECLLPATTVMPECCVGIDGTFEVEAAKQKLYAICGMKKWPRPVYSIEKDEGTSQDKKFVSAVQIVTPAATLQMSGDEKSRVKDAENSAASLMIRALQHHKYV